MTSPHQDAADLVAELRQQARNRAEKFGSGSEIATIEWSAANLIEQQAKALSEAETKHFDADDRRCYWQNRAQAAEARLAEAMKVIEPFAEIAGNEVFQFQTREWRDLVIAKPTSTRLAFIRTDAFSAARSFLNSASNKEPR